MLHRLSTQNQMLDKRKASKSNVAGMNDDLNEVGIDSPVRPGTKTLMSSYLMKVENKTKKIA